MQPSYAQTDGWRDRARQGEWRDPGHTVMLRPEQEQRSDKAEDDAADFTRISLIQSWLLT
jgi:hypothetical protein